MDITDTLAPKSDQMDAAELIEPRVFTIKDVDPGNAEQPVNVHLHEFPRPWRPSKGMRRALATCWGTDSTKWHGRRVLLYCDQAVKFGGVAVGGIRIRAVSDIDKPVKVVEIIAKGRTGVITIDRLPDETITRRPIEFVVTLTAEQVAASSDRDELRSWWQAADETTRALIEARVAELGPKPTEGES